MKAIELEKAYDPKTFEGRIYACWREQGLFKPEAAGSSAGDAGSAKSPGSAFTVAIPPPNVTGVLHLGHGLNSALQDIVVRFHRMRGGPALWVPGTDHAGIATQNVVERRLREQGKSRREIGREKFLEETWKVKREHHAVISEQLARIGASVDWDRERFTLDEGLARAVREVFVTLYERGLLYKGNYLVNWCASCGTALADDEVEHKDTQGIMYRLRYYFADADGDAACAAAQGAARNAADGAANSDSAGNADGAADANGAGKGAAAGGAWVEIATTRPETLLGDTAVAVHPEDERYARLKGRSVRLPLAGRDIPVVFDSYVDRDFGTGVVKITPAHDPSDWEVAKRHGLPVINILSADGTLNGEVPEKYRGMKVKQARAAVLEDLKAGGWHAAEEGISHAVGHCYRCATVIEPFLSEQWFVRMKPLAEKALAAWQRGEVVFYPKKWEHTYRHWLENIRDWCISRQLWWGHRIPAWDCKDCGETAVSRSDLSACPRCGSASIAQDPDVLDTWFSSWLWPFSALGWESADCAAPDFRAFYPTTALITAYDIIFFWVARMIMAGLEFTGKAPFRDIHIHGLVRDRQGRKMSKTLGNGLDPLELVDEFGADALKFTLAFMCAQGQDVLIDKESFKMGSKFANKVWNASRYILMNLDGRELAQSPALLPVDRWIYSRLSGAAKAVEEALLSYRFNDAAQAAYEYFWNDFCDWYVEATKLSLKSGASGAANISGASGNGANSAGADGTGGAVEKDRAATVLLDVLAESLRLLHPLLPFVTEEIYGKLPNTEGLLIGAPYPRFSERRSDPEEERRFAFLQDFVRMVRTLRSECAIAPDKKLRVEARLGGEREALLRQNEALARLLAGIGELEIKAGGGGAGTEAGGAGTGGADVGGAESGSAGRPEGAIGLAGSGFEIFVFIAEAVDIAALKKKFAKELERDTAFTNGLRAKLANEQFAKNAPPELVAGEKAKLENSLARIGKLESYLSGM